MTTDDVSITSNTRGGATESPVEPKLRGRLGAVQLLFTVLAFNGPLALVVGFAPLVIGYGNGVGAPVAYLAAGVVVAVFAAGFVKMARHVQNPGGFYSFVTLGLGRPIGLGASLLALICYYTAIVATYIFVGPAVGNLVANVLGGPVVPGWVWAIVIQAAIGVLGHFNLDLSAKVLSTLLAAEVVMIVVYDSVVMFKGGSAGIHADSFLPASIVSGSPGIALLFAVMCMGGFEATVIFRDEVRNPDKVIPRATYLFVGVVALIYAGTTWMIVSALGEDNAVAATAADPAGSFFTTVRQFLGTVAVDIASVLLCTSLIASILAVHNVLARYVFNLGVDKILPARLGRVHPKHGSPAQASAVTSLAILIGYTLLTVFGGDPMTLYPKASAVAGYALLLLLLLTGVAILLFMARTRPEDTTIWHRSIAPMLAILGFLGAVYLATANFDVLMSAGSVAEYATYVALYGTVLVGIVAALWLRRRRPGVYRHIGRQ
ncbi:APC family permease [Nocardia sp. R16R-3T]